MKYLLLSLIWGCFTAVSVASVTARAQAAQVSIAVTLNPAGDFKAQTDAVTGFATATADGVMAENITVDTRTLKTGLALRDKHLQKTLMSDKFPFVKLIKATGKAGKGTGTLEVRGMKTDVSGDYKVEGASLTASFKMHLPDVKISDINYMGVGVEDDITITVKVPMKSAAAASGNSQPAAPSKAAPAAAATKPAAPAAKPAAPAAKPAAPKK